MCSVLTTANKWLEVNIECGLSSVTACKYQPDNDSPSTCGVDSNIPADTIETLTIQSRPFCGDKLEINQNSASQNNLPLRSKTILKLIAFAAGALKTLSAPWQKWVDLVSVSPSVEFPKLNSLNLKHESKNDQFSIDTNFCSNMPSLSVLILEVGYFPLEELQKLWSCTNLTRLEARVKVPKNIKTVTLSHHLVNYPKKLRYVNLMIIFDAPDGSLCSVKGDLPPNITATILHANCEVAASNETGM